MDDPMIADKLRTMAEHRGLKLVKSRKRKPGTGDYGKFGLTDAAGKALLGVEAEGLTASAADIEEYLRAGAADTWKASAEVTPARVDEPADVKESEQLNEPQSVPVARSGARSRKGRRSDRGRKAEAAVARESRPSRAASRQPSQPEGRVTHRVGIAPAPEPEPELEIRLAKSGDAAALSPLLAQLTHIEMDELAIARNLTALIKSGGGMVVAEKGALVGCCSWAIVPTVQHGVLGRITILIVDADHRRQGVGSAMLEAATGALRREGCTSVEAMSDIEIAHSHGFFRALNFEQTSYRFARKIEDPQ